VASENSHHTKRLSLHRTEKHNRKAGDGRFKRQTRQQKVRRNDNRSLGKLAGDWQTHEPKLPRLWKAQEERDRPKHELEGTIAEALRRAGWNS
jgi:hypothetical protein